ncbi:MAG: sigma-70 family RNA polymerase sigma factor [bacterium]|nr:sigma-70 family RNA polymerase sigma factor [bacterium]
MSVSTTDNVLLERWTRGRDAHAFAEIVERHSGMVYGVCRRILRNPADAEDVAQDCFIELAHAKRPVRRSLAGWLHALAATRSLDRIRSEKRRQAREIRYAANASSENAADWQDVWAEVDEAIAALPESLRAPIVCRFLEGQSQEAVAQRLGTSRTTVQRRLDQGVQRIRALLRRRGVISTAAALTAAFEAHTAEAAPPALTATLGKLALSGGAAGMKAAVVGGGMAVMTKVALGVAAAAVAFGALWMSVGTRNDSAEPANVAGSAQASLPPRETQPQPDGNAHVPLPGSAGNGVHGAGADATMPSGEDAPPAQVTATMRGRVVDSRGLPVAGQLSYQRAEDGVCRSVEMDASGAFEARNLSPGRYLLTNTFCRTSNHSLFGLAIEPFLEVELSPGEVREDIVVRFPKRVGQAEVAFRAINAQGEPIPGVQVFVMFGGLGHSGSRTDREGRYTEHHVPDWESEGFAKLSHRDYETQEFFVPIGKGEVDLVMQAKEPGGLHVTVVDAWTGRPIPNAEVGKDGTWQSTKRGAVLYPELSSAKHRIEARAPGYQAVREDFEIPPGQTLEGTMELFPPASARVSLQVEGHMLPLQEIMGDLASNHRAHVWASSAGGARAPLGRTEWQEDDTAVCPVSAGQRSDVTVSLSGMTHAEDRPETYRNVAVNGLVVPEGKEAKLLLAVGNGTCVLRVPRINAITSDSIHLYRDGDRPGVDVKNASYEGVSEHRQIRVNREGMFVAGDLHPGTYRLSAQLRVDGVPVNQEHFVTFTRENEELALDW